MLYIISQVFYIAFIFFPPIWLPVCCFDWVISVILFSGSLILSSALYILLSIAFSSTFVLASEF